MNTFDAIQRAIAGKTVAHSKALHLSVSSVNKWQEPSKDFDDSGSYNPLDRIETIIETSLKLDTPREDALAPIQYLAASFNCLLIPLPNENPSLKNMHYELAALVKEFGHLMEKSADAMADGRITADELRAVEHEAQHLQYRLGLFLQTASGVSSK